MRERAFPPPVRDLDDPAEVAEMVRRFYSDVAQDDLLGLIFSTERWLDLFCETVDLGWTGPKAEKAKAFAVRVARAHGRQLQ